MINPFKQPGRWLRGNTHSHSTMSDGRLPLEERFAQYREGGYQFLVLTDHGKVSDVSACSTQDFLAVSGSELHPPNPYGGDTYHFVAINIHEPVPYAGYHPNEVIQAVRDQGGLAVLCHPYWCGHTLRDLAPLEGYFAVEVYNDTCEQLIGKGHSEAHWDDLLDTVGPCWGIAADDSHHQERDVFHGWIMVKAPDLTLPALLQALQDGAFYSTQGPEFLDLDLREEEVPYGEGTRLAPVISVRCSPVRAIAFKAQRSRGKRFLADPEQGLTEAEYAAGRGEKYVRVEITDAEGRKAWSNPVFFSPVEG
jgi:predicted metal-dependent phosphoesterase TrpH